MTKFEYSKRLPFQLGDRVTFQHWLKNEKVNGIVIEIRFAYEPGTDKIIMGRELYTVKHARYPDLGQKEVPIAWHAEGLMYCGEPAELSLSERKTLEKQELAWSLDEILDLTGVRQP